MSTLLVVAHPDDEVLGAGIWIYRHQGDPVHIVHVTDGSPRDLYDARRLGFLTRSSYARARRAELYAALDVIGLTRGRCRELGVADKEAFLNLPSIVNQLEDLIGRLRADHVITCAYEGGHPDHDAVACAVAAARRRVDFRLTEFPLYHADSPGRMVTGKFLPPARASQVIVLNEQERKMKSRMLDCFPSQQDMLRHFQVGKERFRPAPEYDFTAPPHQGELLYERWGWGITGTAWREKAGEIGNDQPVA